MVVGFLLLAVSASAGTLPVWSLATPMPVARAFAGAACTIGGIVYVVGGDDGADVTGRLDAYDPATNMWTSLPSMPTARWGVACAAWGGKLYVFGGQNDAWGILNTVEAYDTTLGTWATKSSIPQPVRYAVAAELGGKIYLAGGATPTPVYGITTVRVYDPVMDTWSAAPDMPAGEEGAAGAVFGGRLYIFGGEHGIYGDVDSSVFMFDPGTSAWSVKGPMPRPRVYFGMVEAEGVLHAVGGWSGPYETSFVDSYDPGTDTWDGEQRLPLPRANGGFASSGGDLYVCGGFQHWSDGPVATVFVGVFRPYAALSVTPDNPVVGQPVEVVLTYTNQGKSTLATVTPAAMGMAGAGGATLIGGPSPPFASGLPWGGTTSFTWSFSTTAAGYVMFSVPVGGYEAALSSTAWESPEATVVVREPARFDASLTSAPASACVGQRVDVVLTVKNSGEAGAVNVSAPVPAVSGAGTALFGLGPVPAMPVSLAGGASRSFTWTYTSTGSGEVVFTTTVTGTDAVLGTAITAATAVADGTAVSAVPGGLAVSVGVQPEVSVGQWVNVTMDLANPGDTPVLDVTAPGGMRVSGAAGTLVAGPLPAGTITVDALGTASIAWTFSVGGAGTIGFSATAVGYVCGTNGVTATAWGITTAVTRARLEAALAAFPTPRSTGQGFLVTLTVTNTGGAAVSGLAVSPAAIYGSGTAAALSGPSPPVPFSLGAGASVVLTWTYTGVLAGLVAFGVTVSGADANAGFAAGPALAVSGPVSIQAAAHLAASLSVAPDPVCVGDVCQLMLTVTNTGQAAVMGFSVAGPSGTGTGTAWVVAGPVPALPGTLAGGASVTVGWTVTAVAAGSVGWAVTVSGADANSGQFVNAAALQGMVVVTPAVLTAAAATPATVSVGQWITVTVTVTNTGQAGASGVAPAVPGVTGPGSAVVVVGPSPVPPVAVAGGAAVTFAWTVSVAGSGMMGLTTTVTGTACAAEPLGVVATAGTSAVLPATLVAAVAVSATRLVVGEWVTVWATVTNTGGAAALNVAAVLTPAGPPVTIVGSPVSLPVLAPGSSSTFTWTLSTSGSGVLNLQASAAGVDGNGGWSVTSGWKAAPAVTVAAPARFTIQSFVMTPGGVVDLGGGVQVSLTLRNSGDAEGIVDGISVGEVESAPAAFGLPGAVSPVLPVTVGGGGTAVFGWSYATGACGRVQVTVTVTGTEPETGRTLPAVVAWSAEEAVAGAPVTLQLAPAATSGVVLSQVAVTARLLDTCGIGVPGRTLSFSANPGDARVEPGSRTTGVDGTAAVVLTLGGDPGPNTVQVLLANPLLTATAMVQGTPSFLSLAEPGSALDVNVLRPGSGTPVRVRIAPNAGGSPIVRVFTASGRLVQTLLRLEPIGGGQYMVEWDGRDHDGALVGRGVYLIKVEGGGAYGVLKIVVR